MEQPYNVLIIDDHPLIIEAYKNALLYIEQHNKNFSFVINIAHTCDVALTKIKFSVKDHPFDLIFLDIKIPPSLDGEILSGEDLGIKINELLKEVRIIVSTTYNDNYRVNNILKNVNPDGFLIKNDIDPEELVTAIKTVLVDPPYYSKTVIKLLRKHVFHDFILDKVDRQILYELSIGTKMKNLPDMIPLSIAAIERRKRHLKEVFYTSGQDDKALILMAKEKGFI